jgi:hypothetical protein
VAFEDRGQEVAVCGRVEELVFLSFRIEKGAHGIEFAKVQSENFHG